MDKNKIVMYTDKNGNVELRADIDKDTLWATQDQVAAIFDTTKQNIGKHLKNIFQTGELLEDSVVNKSFTTAKDGKKYKVGLYNLDAIIAVGYRINSKKATQFRIWATNTLREYLLKGYKLDTRKLEESSESLVSLDEAVALMRSGHGTNSLKGKLTLKLTKKIIP